jgi:hypothetical protein
VYNTSQSDFTIVQLGAGTAVETADVVMKKVVEVAVRQSVCLITLVVPFSLGQPSHSEQTTELAKDVTVS